jgi:hypothetical protein
MATAPLNDVSNYKKAADLATEIMQEGNYKLVPDITKVFSLETKYGPEMMWSFNSNYADINTDPQIYRPGQLGGWGDFRIQREWEQNIPSQPRKDAYVLTQINGVPYQQWTSNQTPFIKKFMYDKQEDFDKYSSVMNMPIIRYADVLLIFAEAENMANGGPTQAAVEAINQVIDRANGNTINAAHPKLTTAMTKEAFDAAVIEERNQELCFEFDRLACPNTLSSKIKNRQRKINMNKRRTEKLFTELGKKGFIPFSAVFKFIINLLFFSND